MSVQDYMSALKLGKENIMRVSIRVNIHIFQLWKV